MKFIKTFTLAIAFFCTLNFAQATTAPINEQVNPVAEINLLDLNLDQVSGDEMSEPKKKRKKR